MLIHKKVSKRAIGFRRNCITFTKKQRHFNVGIQITIERRALVGKSFNACVRPACAVELDQHVHSK